MDLAPECGGGSTSSGRPPARAGRNGGGLPAQASTGCASRFRRDLAGVREAPLRVCRQKLTCLFSPARKQALIGVHTAVAQEWPDLANLFDPVAWTGHHGHFRATEGRLVQDAP